MDPGGSRQAKMDLDSFGLRTPDGFRQMLDWPKTTPDDPGRSQTDPDGSRWAPDMSGGHSFHSSEMNINMELC